MVPDDDVDYAVAAFHEGGVWQVAELAHDHAADIEGLAAALRRFPSDHGALGMVAVAEDFFVLVRVAGPRTRVLLSDITAATDFELAASAVDFLHLPQPEYGDEREAAGDLGLLRDLGVRAIDLAVLLDDEELHPDELLSDVAQRLGFGRLFDDAIGLTSA
ncbi:tRNA adenosine deaminase-associated protein [Nocardioides sp. TF02-7]|uniref:tRNA adenosine deaminase-associated protein n=1 Tax=Nocardioides sp. TF02-7 TaxID=2917724 RepID=UPI001F05DF94|nr:tRNA adenosine deaminase-associated protein [Nocardioides sp. TF02-7]UMG94505.1 tRNA adenosine deaminase-associated protein [Nocardioides sp. TF02-7]